jgi:hypothetical protein
VRHSLIGKEQGHAVISHFQLLQESERTLRRIASYHTVFGAVLRTQVTLDGTQDI